MSRLYAGITVSLAALAIASTAVGVTAPPRENYRSATMCRRAASLAQLGPERQAPHQQQRPLIRGRASPAPPPAMAAPMAEVSGGGDIVVTGTMARAPKASDSRAERRMSADVYEPSRPGYGSQIQTGTLTAGDHDDLLNPELYAHYVRDFLRQQRSGRFPQVDTRRVLTVAVKDGSGRPIPFADVTITCSDGNSLSLAALADGTVNFYPGLDRLSDRLRLDVRSGGAAGASRTILLGRGAGAQRHTVSLAAPAAAVRKFDLMVMIDTTGSMGDELDYLKTELRSILNDLNRSHPGLDIRLGLVAYRDEGDEYVTRTFPFTGNLDVMQSHIRAQHADGGGDYPEAMDQALARSVSQGWRPDAVKSLLLIADAPPHDDKLSRTWAITEAARAKRIQIVPVAASGVGDTAEYMMRAMAAATQSRYIFLTDDSGVGNPHAEPAVDCYLVTHLDALIRRVLDTQISGRRVEPGRREVIRTVGDYDNGRCVLPADFGRRQ
jgi:hypothetical protein